MTVKIAMNVPQDPQGQPTQTVKPRSRLPLLLLALAAAAFVSIFDAEDFMMKDQRAAHEAAEAAKEKDEKQKGLHCSDQPVRAYVKARLRDPGSFEHVESKITPADKHGEHTLLMTFRARNGFGGINVEQVTATLYNNDCSVRAGSIR